MVLKADQMRVKALLAETITLLCKNGLHFKDKFSIQALIGITLDEDDVFLVNINETIASREPTADFNEDSGPFEQQPLTGKRSRGAISTRTTSGPSPGPASPGVKPLGGNSTIPKVPLNAHSRSTRSSRQESPHSVTATRLSEVVTSTRPAETFSAAGVFGTASDSAEMTSDSLPSANVGISECGVGGGDVTFPAVSIKNDSQSNDTSYDDSKPLPEESDLPDEPSSKRARLRPDARSEPSVATPTSSEVNANFTSSREATKSEPTDIIEIKEESYSDSESQLPNYSAYSDYNAAMYGSGNPDMTHGFGEASMFQAGSSFFVPQSVEGEQTPEQWNVQAVRSPPQVSRSPRKVSTRTRGTFECAECGQKFAWRENLLQHKNTKHGRRPHPLHCQLCRKGFWSQRDFRGHLASKHNMQKDFCCWICGREYSYKAYLKVHLHTCHGIGE